MSSWRPIAALLLLVAPAAAAQGREGLAAEMHRLERRVDSLRAQEAEATALVAAAATGVPPAKRLASVETMRVGGLLIRANRSPLPLESAAAEVWARLEGYFGEELGSLPLRAILVEGIHPDSSGGELEESPDLELPWNVSHEELVQRLLGLMAPDPLDSALTRWLGGRPVPDLAFAASLTLAREQLILSPFSTGQACVAGDLVACRGVFRLEPEARWVEFGFPEAKDRLQVAQTVGLIQGGALVPGMKECLAGQGDAACATAIHALDPAALPAIADLRIRRTLLELALRRGGPQAFHRLRATPSPSMDVRLAAAAGVPIDTLLSEWRAEMFEAVRVATPWSTKVGFAGIGWIGLLLVCALWSSRWRAD